MLRRDRAMKFLIEKGISDKVKLIVSIDRPVTSCVTDGDYVVLKPCVAEIRSVQEWKDVFKNKVIALYNLDVLDNGSVAIRYCIIK